MALLLKLIDTEKPVRVPLLVITVGLELPNKASYFYPALTVASLFLKYELLPPIYAYTDAAYSPSVWEVQLKDAFVSRREV